MTETAIPNDNDELEPMFERGPDNFLARHTVLSFAPRFFAVCGSDLDDVYNFYLAIILIIVVPFIVLLPYLTCALILNVATRRWKRSLSVLIAPVIACSVFAMLIHADITLEKVRFTWKRSDYLSQVVQPRDNSAAFAAWPWAETGGAGVVRIFKTLVYDPSGEIIMTPAQRSVEWMKKAKLSVEMSSPQMYLVFHPEKTNSKQSVTVTKIGRDFYVVVVLYA